MFKGLGRTASIDEYIDFFVEEPLKKRAVRYVAGFLEYILGQPLRIPVPDASRFDLACARPLSVAKRLKDVNFLSGNPSISPHYHDEPFIYRSSFGERSGGADLFNLENSLWKALAEFVERKVWRESDEWYKNSLRVGTRAEVKGIALQNIAGFSPEQRSSSASRNLKYDESTVFGWVKAKSLTKDESVHVPAQLLSSHYLNGAGKNEPMLRWSVTTGLATGQDIESAALRGALEVIERDAFMITYLNGISAPRVDLEYAASTNSAFAKLLERFKRYGLDLFIVLPPTDFNVTVAIGIIIDRSGKGPALTVGARADFDPTEAVIAATCEALSVRISRKGHQLNTVPDSIPFSSFTRNEHINYWIDPSRLPSISFLTEGPLIKLEGFHNLYNKTLSSNPEKYREQLALLKKMLSANNCEMYAADLTPRLVREHTPFRVVNVVSPQLMPLHLIEEIPYCWGERLVKIPQRFGYPKPKKLNSLPHPFP